MRNFSFSVGDREKRLLGFQGNSGSEKPQPQPPTIETKVPMIEVSDRTGAEAEVQKEVESADTAMKKQKETFAAITDPILNVDMSPVQKGRVRGAEDAVKKALRPRQSTAQPAERVQQTKTPVQKNVVPKTSVKAAPKVVKEAPKVAKEAPKTSAAETPKVVKEERQADPDIGSQGVVKDQVNKIFAMVEKGEDVQNELSFLNDSLIPQVLEEGTPPRAGWEKDVKGPEGISRLRYENGKIVLETPKDVISKTTSKLISSIAAGKDTKAELEYLNKIVGELGPGALRPVEGWSRTIEVPTAKGVSILSYKGGKFDIAFVTIEQQASEKLAALSKTADAAMATYKEAEGNGTMNRSVVNRAVEALEALADALVTGPNAQRNFRSVLFTQTDASLKEVLAKRDEMDAREQKREEADKNLATLRDDADRAFATFSENQEKGTLTRAEAEEAFNALDMLFAELSSRGDGKQNSQSVLFKKTEEKQKEITQWLAQN